MHVINHRIALIIELDSVKIMDYMNRRKFHRIDFDGKVDLQFIGTSYDYCKVKNLSLTGMCVLGDFAPQGVENCSVKLFHKEKSGNNSVKATGKVVWKSNGEIGLQFTGMTFENYMLLQTTLINKAENPAVVLREFPETCPFIITGK